MNKKYIKRQLTLDELGIPMDDDIQMMYDLFNELIGNLNELLSVTSVKSRRTYWMKDNQIILEYNIIDRYFNIDSYIWTELSKEYILGVEDLNKIVSAFLEKQLNVEIEFSHSMWWFERECLKILE